MSGTAAAARSPARREATEEEVQSARVRFRRAVALLLMTFLLPGSAQLMAGNRRTGRIAVLVVAATWIAVIMIPLLAWLSPNVLVTLFTSTAFLVLLRLVLFVLALGWIGLFVDAWRLGRPLGLSQRHRLALFGVNTALCALTTAALLFLSHLVSVQQDFIVSVFGGDISEAENGRYNILLLGGDAGADRWGMRPDSITLASVDAETGRTVLFGLPRNLANVPFAEDSPMAERFPDGFDCDGCYLNAVNTWVAAHPRVYGAAHTEESGVEATKDAVEGVTGLKVNYTAIIEMGGFADLVDALGGVTVNVEERLPIGGIGAPIHGWIEPGLRRLSGFEALWYSRSRATSDDYSRMARQKCMMQAMLTQLDPGTVLTKFQEIARAGKELVHVDLPASQIGTFLDLSRRARSLPVGTTSFVPPLVQTSDPDFDQIRQIVEDAVDRAEAADETSDEDAGEAVDEGVVEPSPSPVPTASAEGGEAGPATRNPANATGDLGGAC